MPIHQTGCPFHKSFIEHLAINKIHEHNSRYAEHLINSFRTYFNFGKNIAILHVRRKGQIINSLEEFEIYKAKSMNLHTY